MAAIFLLVQAEMLEVVVAVLVVVLLPLLVIQQELQIQVAGVEVARL